MEQGAPLTDPTRGHVVAGRYPLLSLCGRGGMGGVWHARHLQDGRECAVKILQHTAPERIPRLAERSSDGTVVTKVLDFGVAKILDEETISRDPEPPAPPSKPPAPDPEPSATPVEWGPDKMLKDRK